jgi:two-component system, chemotaxis family, protein-glutamate methylesterase/glutaminase
MFVPPNNAARNLVVIAASAGGVRALETILGALPASFPAAIAIVLHLSPRHPSFLAEILNRRTALEVRQARDGDELRHGLVFVAPPNHHMLLDDCGILRLSTSEKVHFSRPSAEPLFASAAAFYKERAIAVVLTGGDHDGSIGVQIVKKMGGRVIAQDRATSQQFSMPYSSIITGAVDFILPIEKIAPKLMQLLAGAGTPVPVA